MHQQVGEIGLDRGGRSTQARTRGVEKANEKGGYVEGRVGGRKGPRLLIIQETTNSKQTATIRLVPFI